MRPPLLVVALAAVLMTGSAVAQEETSRMIGQGGVVCDLWTALRENKLDLAASGAKEWVLGFLSGVGYVGSPQLNPLRGTDAGAVWAWIDQYCHEHPRDRIATAAMAFADAHPH